MANDKKPTDLEADLASAREEAELKREREEVSQLPAGPDREKREKALRERADKNFVKATAAAERERLDRKKAEEEQLPPEVRAARAAEDAEVQKERDAVAALPVGWERERREAALREREQALSAQRPSAKAVFLETVFRNLAYEIPRPARLEEIVEQAEAQLRSGDRGPAGAGAAGP